MNPFFQCITAIRIVTMIGQGRIKLIQQISMGRMNFDSVISGSLGPACRCRVFSDKHLYFFNRKFPWRYLALFLTGMQNRRGPYGLLPCHNGVCHGAGMIDLGKDPRTAFTMYAFCQLAQAGNITVAGNGNLIGICFPLLVNIHMLCNDQSQIALFCPLLVVFADFVINIAMRSRTGSHRRHDNTVCQRQMVDRQRFFPFHDTSLLIY